MKILLVDDSAVLLKILKTSMLKIAEDRVSIDTCLDAYEAEKILEEQEYDLLVTDIVMPDKSGVELIQTLREKGNDIKICVYSSVRDQKTLDELNQLNVSLFLMKPGVVADVSKEILELILVIT
jgi:DNA-binding NarL/FixJ family response regulator